MMRLWIIALVLSLLLALATPASASPFYSQQRKRELRELAHETWKHAYNSYKRVAFPSDELLPLSCAAQGHDRANPDNVGVNDVMGDYSTTLVDSLDTFAVRYFPFVSFRTLVALTRLCTPGRQMLNDRAGFEQAVRETIEHVSFDVDSRVQVFEVTIRMMGGLVRLSTSLTQSTTELIESHAAVGSPPRPRRRRREWFQLFDPRLFSPVVPGRTARARSRSR